MRRLWMFIVFMLPLTVLMSQNDDEIVSGSSDIEYDRGVDVSRSMHPLQAKSPNVYEYNHFFLEGQVAYESNGSLGLGGIFTYLPKWIGGYASSTAYESHSMFTIGPAFRPLANIVSVDWQLFGGLAYVAPITKSFNYRLGFEIGTRFAPNGDGNWSRFAWWSLSISRLYVNGNGYYTIGLSVNLMSLFGVAIFI